MSQAELSGSSRLVKPSISRLATWPGSGAFCQLSIGANSHASGLSVPPARRCLRYATVSRKTVPTAPASRPATTAPSGVSGCFAVFIASSNRCAVGGRPGKVDRIRSAQLPAAIAADYASWWPRGGWVEVVELERRGGVVADLLQPQPLSATPPPGSPPRRAVYPIAGHPGRARRLVHGSHGLSS